MRVLKAFLLAALIIALAPFVGVFLFVELLKHAHHIAGQAYQAFGEWL